MNKSTVLVILIAVVLFFVFSFLPLAFAGTQAVEYLCEFAKSFYQVGRYDDALAEFKKVLLLDPNNKTAGEFINNIFAKQNPSKNEIPYEIAKKPAKEAKAPVIKKITREQAMESALESKGKAQGEEGLQVAGINISGEAQARMGMAGSDFVWKRANWDLNEKNWRIMSSAAFDRKENTYDPRVYDRLKVNLDTGDGIGFGFHSNITVDPWSFTGKSSKFQVSHDGDSAQLELKYWSNTGYTLNESINTLTNGDSFALPEIKVLNGKITTPVVIASAYGNTFTLPEEKIYRQFQPIRELMLDYKNDTVKLNVFPIAYENQALTFDDPLRLSNNRTWWEDSPWLHGWTHGNFNSGATPVDFTKGLWDNTLSFFTRDSEGQRLTALRGFTFQFDPQESTSFTTSLASPKTLWQDYSQIDNFLSASRLKQSLRDNLTLGLTATTRLGYNADDNNQLDATNYVAAADLAYEVIEGLKTDFEIAYSQSRQDLTDEYYKTDSRGNAYYFSLIGRYPLVSVKDIDNGFDGIQPEKEDKFFTKFRFFASRMDSNFDESLSSYVETRDDEWWSRHLHFRTPFKYYYQGEGQLLAWDDIKNFGIGNGIDIGRSVLGLRIESLLWDKKLSNLFDVRNVHDTNSKFIENVARDEITWEPNDRLTTKFLGIWQRLPKTKAGFDPFIFDPRTRNYFTNTVIEDGKDPSVATGSLGAEYKFFDWLSLSGIWEYTNDISLAYDNYPRGTFNTASRSFVTTEENNNRYRDILASLYNQGFFPKPPYPYYNIFKAGLSLKPIEKVDIYLDYTRNSYEKAGQVDDNMNHVGLEFSYRPMPKLALFFKYSYSRWQDLDKLQTGNTKLFGHQNFFAELIFRKSEDEDLSFQYGEASRDPYMGGVLDIGWDPYGGSLRTIDTQHVFRAYYRRKF